MLCSYFFPKVYTCFMAIMCVHQSGSRQENRNFGKSFKLIQEIGYTGNRRVKKPNRMMRYPRDFQQQKAATTLRAWGKQGRCCFIEMRRWGHLREAWIMVETPRGRCCHRGRSWSISTARNATGTKHWRRQNTLASAILLPSNLSLVILIGQTELETGGQRSLGNVVPQQWKGRKWIWEQRDSWQAWYIYVNPPLLICIPIWQVCKTLLTVWFGDKCAGLMFNPQLTVASSAWESIVSDWDCTVARASRVLTDITYHRDNILLILPSKPPFFVSPLTANAKILSLWL